LRKHADWSLPLPRPLKIPTVMMLKTLADVRELVERHLSAEWRQRDTWRHVAKQLAAAADGGDINDVVVSLRLELHLERVPYLPQ
jgi:hypothetical protein